MTIVLIFIVMNKIQGTANALTGAGGGSRSGRPGKCRTKILKPQPIITVYVFGM